MASFQSAWHHVLRLKESLRIERKNEVTTVLAVGIAGAFELGAANPHVYLISVPQLLDSKLQAGFLQRTFGVIGA